MSKYTTEVRYIIAVNSDEDLTIDEQITAAAPKIFNFDFPYYGATTDRQQLEEAILLHYYMREIGFETVGLWKLYLKQRLREIMPYYIQLWETTQREFDYLEDVNWKEGWGIDRNGTATDTIDDTTKGESESTSTGKRNTSAESNENVTRHDDSNTKQASSDLPQTNLQFATTNLDYANEQSMQDVNSNGTTNTTANSSGSESSSNTDNATSTVAYGRVADNKHDDTETGSRERKGLTGSHTYPELIQQYRDSLLQIPRMIIEDLSDLFMGLW